MTSGEDRGVPENGSRAEQRGAEHRPRGELRREDRESATEKEAAEMARIVARRAIKRLDMLEWVIFIGGAILATLSGGVVAWLMAGIAGWDFRSTWMGASILLFVVPGLVAIIKIKKEERSDALRAEERRRDDG